MKDYKKKKLLKEINEVSYKLRNNVMTYESFVKANLHALELHKKGLKSKDMEI